MKYDYNVFDDFIFCIIEEIKEELNKTEEFNHSQTYKKFQYNYDHF